MAPERFQGHDDSRGDIYSLGLTLYELATGVRPFAGSDAAVIAAIVNQAPVRPSDVRSSISRDLDALILRAYEKGIVGAHQLARVVHEWRNPAFEEFRQRTAWSLFNAFTSALRERSVEQPHAFAVQTMQLNGLLDFRPAATSLSA